MTQETDDDATLKRLEKDLSLPPADGAPSSPAPTDAKASSSDGPSGLEFAGSIITGSLIGIGLDTVFDTAPFLLILFFLLGVVAGFWAMYRLSR